MLRRGPRISRKIALAAIGVGGVALSGVLVSALIPGGSAKISLSSNSSREHHQRMVRQSPRHHHWVWSTLDNRNDPTFNQLLGINNRGQIAGYFGSGAQEHPNKGYLLVMTRRGHATRYRNENVPGAQQTQVTGLNDLGITVGFWSNQNSSSMMNANYGFYSWGGHFATVDFPAANNATPAVNQLLGVNDSNIAVGFYADAKGNNHGYIYNIGQHRFRSVKILGATSVTAAAINNRGDIAGFFTNAAGVTKGFVRHWFGPRTTLAYPGATMTQAFGVNDLGEVVGTYAMGTGSSAKTYGFFWTRQHGFKAVSDPHGIGATTINGVNDAGDLVGFYTDAAGNTDGVLLAARFHRAPFAPAPAQSAMPTASPSRPAPSMTAMPTMTPAPTMSATAMPSAAPSTSAPAPTSSASPPGGPW